MTGHRPWETLLERLSPERREAIAEGAAKMRVDIERHRQDFSRTDEEHRAHREASAAEGARTTS